MSTEALSIEVLKQCRKKLEIYRDHSKGQYHGGIEHTALIGNIDRTLKILEETRKRQLNQ